MKRRIEGRDEGFSLVELMVIVGLLAFLGMMAGTTFDTRAWLTGYRLKGAAGELALALQQAKMEAVKRDVFCTITFNQPVDGVTYDYVVYTDLARNLEFDSTQDTVLKKASLSKYPGVTINSNTFAKNDHGRPSVAYDPKGLSKSNSGAMGMGSVVLRDISGKQRVVIVNGWGRVRTEEMGQ